MPTSKAAPPLILLTNDDGFESPGLRAAAHAALPLGELLVVAPDRQWSGAGRSMPPGPKEYISHRPLEVNGQPALLISGINYGENLGSDVTVSGTVGAALEGAVNGLPALAVSLQTPKETHAHPSDDVDFTAAIHFTRLFARLLLTTPLPFDADVLKIDVPSNATPETPWRLTRVSRHVYFTSIPPQQTNPTTPLPIGETGGKLDYAPLAHPERTEPDSDIYALAVDRVVSVAPLSLDLTSRIDREEMEALLRSSTEL